MPAFEPPEFVDLFTTYTAGPTSIGAHLAAAVARESVADPLIVATGTDIALYPGRGAAPSVEPYRLSTRGFKELAAISHLGPAMATLVRLRELDERGCWRADAEQLHSACKAVRSANSERLWREEIAVRAFAGREAAIAAMVDYSCSLTERLLAHALDDPTSLTAAGLDREYLSGPADGLAVPFDRVMIATFFLTGLDLAHRIVTWFDDRDVAWERAMVIIAGQAGRPTAGVTRESNSVAGLVHASSRGRLAEDRMYIAPHAAVFPSPDGEGAAAVAALEDDYRRLWSSLQAASDLGARMFPDYPRFRPQPVDDVPVDERSRVVHQKPSVRSADDWFALVTRLRVVMEDPRQLLSGAVTDYAGSQLIAHDNDPSAVVVPGLDGEPYPHLDEELP